MKKVAEGLYVGNDADVVGAIDKGYAICSVCKHGPFGHSNALGYGGGAAPAGPNRLWVLNGNHLRVNAIDSAFGHPDGFKALDHALDFVKRMRAIHKPVLVHCNQGKSRAPSVALAALIENGELSSDLDRAGREFLDLYSRYEPKGGVMAWLEKKFA